MLKRLLLVVFLTLLLLGGLFGFKFYRIKQSMGQMAPPPPAQVAAATVRQEQWSSALAATGSLTAVASVEVSSEVAGMVKSLRFDSGQTVKQGQLLLELDSSTDHADLQGLLAEQKLAQLRVERAARMIEKKFIAQADLDQQQAQLDEANAAVNSKRTLIDKKQIKAPFSGELGIRRVDVGKFLDKGAAIVSLQQLDPIYLDFTLPERHIARLELNQPVDITVQAYPERVFSGRIQAIDPVISSDARAVRVRAKLDNHDKKLRPGMFAQVRIDSAQPRTILSLPDTAISYNPYGNSVFLIVAGQAGTTVQSRQIATGQTRDGRVEVLSGLNAGDRVVSAGQVKLRNGMAVTVDSKPAPGEREP